MHNLSFSPKHDNRQQTIDFFSSFCVMSDNKTLMMATEDTTATATTTATKALEETLDSPDQHQPSTQKTNNDITESPSTKATHHPPSTQKTNNNTESTPTLPDTNEPDTNEPNTNEPNTNEPLSKNAQKRLIKQQKWESQREARKAHQKQQRVAQRAKRVAQGLPANRPRKRNIHIDDTNDTNTATPTTTPTVIGSGIRIAIDCAYEHLMTVKETTSLVSQLCFGYAACRFNPGDPHAVPVTVTSMTPTQRELMLKRAPHHAAWESHGMSLRDAPVTDLFDVASCVYLTADSPNVIQSLDPGNVYIIGGLVDHNRYKHRCLDDAVKLGMQHGRLPLSDFVEMKSRKVLTVNHVVEILVRVVRGGGDWGKAFMETLPARKGALAKIDVASGSTLAQPLSQNDSHDDEDDDDDEAGSPAHAVTDSITDTTHETTTNNA